VGRGAARRGQSGTRGESYQHGFDKRGRRGEGITNSQGTGELVESEDRKSHKKGDTGRKREGDEGGSVEAHGKKVTKKNECWSAGLALIIRKGAGKKMRKKNIRKNH